VSDQDNCLFLHDSYVEAAHGKYFENLANYVCDGLDRCGYVYCPGDMMANNPKWRQPLKVWKDYYRSWIDSPGPMAQMLASVMFDLRPICGDFSLAESVMSDNLERARQNSIFIAHMVSNALTHKPPLGLFGNLTTTKAPDGRSAIDMKHAGVVPIVDIARVYALTAGISEVNTNLRLEAGRTAAVLSENGARDLLAAFEFIALTRLRHQAKQIRAGKKPDNFLVPNELSPLERTQLKDTFQVVKTIQSALSNARQIGAR
jgi:CBS domain-containing protein